MPDENIKGKWLGAVTAPGDQAALDDAIGVYGVHGALLRTGRVILWSGRVETAGYLYRSWTWDPATWSEGDTTLSGVEGRWFLSRFDAGQPQASPPGPVPRRSDEPTLDLFCAHQTSLEDGRLLVVGGASGSAEGDASGNRAIYAYDPSAERWIQMSHTLIRGRWYPTSLALPDGRVAVFSGRQESGSGQEPTVEILTPPSYQPSTVSGGDKTLFIYPGLMMVRGGKIFYLPTTWQIENTTLTGARAAIGPTSAFELTAPLQATWRTFPDTTDPSGFAQPLNPWREEGTFVLLPPAQAGRIMVIGGGFALDSLGAGSQRTEARIDHCEILETQGASPRSIEAGQMHYGRVNVHAVLLPDAKVLILGGHNGVKRNHTEDRLIAEIYDPAATFDPANPRAAFTEAAAMGRSRNYHAVALLLPDGRVLVAGGEDNLHFGGNQGTMELYEPPYCHRGPRPQLVSVSETGGPDDEIAYNGTFEVEAGSAAEAMGGSLVLMRPGAVTHHTDTEQRHVPLSSVYLGGARLKATAPVDPTVAPPGYYLLWLVDSQGLPCQRARFVRLSHRRCRLITDRSTFSVEEVEAATARTVPTAIYVYLDGFLPAEAGVTTPTPTSAQIEAWAPVLRFFDGSVEVTTVVARATKLYLEDTTLPAGSRQRFTFEYSVRFDDMGAFPPVGGPERRTLSVRSEKNGWRCFGRVHLMRQPDPYMQDGPTSWLSTDVRVFKVRAGESLSGVTLSATSPDPIDFLRQVLGHFDDDTTLEGHPFTNLSEDQTASRLQMAETEGGARVYNFAIARVRYRSKLQDAHQVRLHFRLFTTAVTNLDYNLATTYRKRPTTGGNIALPGIAGTEIVTVPFFGRARVDLSTQRFTDQPDDTNRKDIPGNTAGNEVRRYFGAWLDFNQPNSRLPPTLNDTDLGPFPAASLQPIAERIRGRHQCLVAEVDFPTDPIPTGDSPSNNDNLSQRNLAIEGSDNPGGADAHTVALTFDIAPTWDLGFAEKRAGFVDAPPQAMEGMGGMKGMDGMKGMAMIAEPPPPEIMAHVGHEADRPAIIAPAIVDHVVDRIGEGDLLARDPIGGVYVPHEHEHRIPPNFTWFQPDELLIHWGELPVDTRATLFFPGILADDVIRAARLRPLWPRIEKVDEHTILCAVGGVTYLPLPARVDTRQAGLITLVLPDTVRVKQSFKVVVKQLSNLERRIVGSFELRIPVSTGETFVAEEARWYAVLQHIVGRLPSDDRWRPVMERYLGVVGKRVRGFGLDPARVKPGLGGYELPRSEDPSKGACDPERGAGAPRDEREHSLLCRLVRLVSDAVGLMADSACTSCCPDHPPTSSDPGNHGGGGHTHDH